MCFNIKGQCTVCRLSELLASTPKSEIQQNKVLLNMRQTVQEIIPWKVLLPNKTINAAFFCLHLDKVQSTLVENRPTVYNWDGVILYHDNLRSHAAVIICQKIIRFWLGCLHHPPYFPELAPVNYHLFLDLNYSFIWETFDDIDDVKSVIVDIFNSKPQSFHRCGIQLLPEKGRS